MSTVDGQSAPGRWPSSEPADLKPEAVVIPVADADRSKALYACLGWRLDADFSFDDGFRVVQFTPPRSQCSVQFGSHITGASPPRSNSAGDLAAATHRAEPAHAEHEKRIGRADSDWPDWYGEYVVSEQSGQELPV